MTERTVAGAAIGLALAIGLILVLVSQTSNRPRVTVAKPGSIARLAAVAGLPWLTRRTVVLASVGSGVLSAIVATAISGVPVVAVIAGVLAASAPVVLLRRRARLVDEAVCAAWPDAVDVLVSGVRAGMSLSEAVGSLALQGPRPLQPAFAHFVVELRASGSFTDSLRALQDRLADPVADRVIASLLIAREVGGSDLGRVLRTLSSLLREDARIRGEIEGRLSWTVSAARMAVAAPWITVALLCTRPEAVAAYRTAVGTFILIGAAATSVLAYRLMVRIGRLPAEQRLVS